MHLVFMTRGNLEWTNRFINELSTRYVPFEKYNPHTKKLDKLMFQLGVKPIQLWDVNFPKPMWDAVAGTVLRGHNESPHKGQQKYVYGLRKMMGLSKIPKYDVNNHLVMSPHENLNVIGIGVKEDYWITEDGKHVKEKEKTDLSWEGL